MGLLFWIIRFAVIAVQEGRVNPGGAQLCITACSSGDSGSIILAQWHSFIQVSINPSCNGIPRTLDWSCRYWPVCERNQKSEINATYVALLHCYTAVYSNTYLTSVYSLLSLLRPPFLSSFISRIICVHFVRILWADADGFIICCHAEHETIQFVITSLNSEILLENLWIS